MIERAVAMGQAFPLQLTSSHHKPQYKQILLSEVKLILPRNALLARVSCRIRVKAEVFRPLHCRKQVENSRMSALTILQ